MKSERQATNKKKIENSFKQKPSKPYLRMQAITMRRLTVQINSVVRVNKTPSPYTNRCHRMKEKMTVKYIKSRRYWYKIYNILFTDTRSASVSVMCWRKIKWKTKSHNHEHVNKLFNANGKVASFRCVWLSFSRSPSLCVCVFYCGRVFYVTAFLFENEKKNKKYDFIIGVDDLLLAHILIVLCLALSRGGFSLYFYIHEIYVNRRATCVCVSVFFVRLNAYISMWMSLLWVVRTKKLKEKR